MITTIRHTTCIKLNMVEYEMEQFSWSCPTNNLDKAREDQRDCGKATEVYLLKVGETSRKNILGEACVQ